LEEHIHKGEYVFKTGAWDKKGNPVHGAVESVYKFPDLWDAPGRFKTTEYRHRPKVCHFELSIEVEKFNYKIPESVKIFLLSIFLA
jgi:hypothetical protein